MSMRTLVGLSMVMVCATALGQGRDFLGGAFDRADANSDGVVTRDEYIAARTNQFGTRDRNGDGFIDSSDMGERAAARPRVSSAMEALITAMDTNKDSKVSKEEFIDGGAKAFDRSDADRNGSLDAKELEAAKAALKERAER